MATRPFPTDPRLTAIALAYRNPDITLIADEVMPRTPTDFDFSWLKYDLASGFTVPDLKIDRKSYPVEVEFNATETKDQIVAFGLDDFIPAEDRQADNQGVDPRGTATTFMTGLVKLGREIRVANLTFNPASYAPANRVVLSGTSQWNDQANSDPVSAILDALDQPIYRPNIGVFGRLTWSKLRRHPKVVQAVRGTSQSAGVVTRREVVELFELDAIFVGSGFVNTAKKGQTVSTQRVWGKHASFLYRDRAAGPQAGVTWGFTASYGDMMVLDIPNPKRGAAGGSTIRVVERVKELVVAPDLGYFFENAVA